MYKKTLLSLAVASSLTLTGCLDDGDNSKNANPVPNITNPLTDGTTYPLFNPVTSELPIPNDLLFAAESAGDGTMNAGTDPANPVVTGIDFLDGNSVIGAFDIKFSGSLDSGQELDARSFINTGSAIVPNPDQNVFLLPLEFPSGDGLLHPDEVPTFAEALDYKTAVAAGDTAALAELAEPVARAEIVSLDGGTNNVLRLNPLTPLEPETKYLVVITNRVVDSAGNPVGASSSYQNISDPNSPLGSSTLQPVRDAVVSWEQLAAGYFGFMQTVFDSASPTSKAPTADDIVFSITFTTGGTDTVLKSIASPATFFNKKLTIDYKQEAIGKLVAGTYNVSGDNTGLTGADASINTTINFLLTSPFLNPPTNTVPNALYNADIATAIAAGAPYSTIAADATAAFIMQKAAAEASISVNNGDGITIAQEAAGTAAAVNGSAPLPTPKSRTTTFYQADCLGSVATGCASPLNPALTAPALVYQGAIDLPYYQFVPTDSDGSNIKAGSWQADTAVGAVIDAGAGNDAGTTPPSSMVTYRYPVPTEQAEVTVPILAVAPNAAVTGTFGQNKPAAGWPVVICQHGITTDRSAVLPMADALAFACVKSDLSGPSGLPCFATIAIDQPLHGVAPAGSTVPGLTSVSDPNNAPTGNIVAPPANLKERHFNFTADAGANPIPMVYTSGSEVGSSGSLFINLTNFANSRDNLRQMSVDLMNLNASIANMDIDGNPGNGPDLDPTQVYFIGHSLGGVNGIPFVSVNNDSEVQDATIGNTGLNAVVAASLLNTGGGVPKLLENSPNTSFGAAAILPGLAAASDGALTQGTSALESYFSVLQGAVDSGDAMNFADGLSDGNTGILLTEIVGDTVAGNPSDQTIPNGADTRWGVNNGPLNTTTSAGFVINSLPAPLAGTEPLINQFGASPIALDAPGGDKLVVVSRFTEGQHGTPVSAGSVDGDSSAVFLEMVSQTAQMFGTQGTGILSLNPAIINSDPVVPSDD